MEKIKVLFRFGRTLKQYWKETLLASTVIAAELGFVTVGPLFTKVLVDEALPGQDIVLLIAMIILYFSFMALEGVMKFINVNIFSGLNKRLFIEIRNSLFNHIQKLSIKFFSEKKGGELLMRLSYDVDNLEKLSIGNFLNLIKNIILIIVVFILMFMLNRTIGLYTLSSLLIFVVLLNKSGGIVYKAAEKFQQAKERLSGSLQENIVGMKMIKTYNLESFCRRKIKSDIYNSEELKRKYYIANSLSSIIGSALFLIVSAVMWGIGSFEILNEKLSIGGFFAIITYFQLLTGPIGALLNELLSMQGAISSANRVFELMDMKEDDGDEVERSNINLPQGRITFEKVSLSYENRGDTLKDVNITFEPGEVTALIGHSGAGKTTLINMIMSFFNPTSGKVCIDGQELAQVKGRAVREHISLVSQDTFLFNTTIRENIKLGNDDISDEQMIEAAKMLRLHHCIEQMPDGYDTEVGERGLRISGGQRKLIDLCRAILKRPKILILDEATSELDSITESIIKETLLKMAADITVIIISHRIATLSWVKKIAVLNNGIIEAIGDHEQLVGNNQLYRELYKQFTYEEHRLVNV